MNKRFFGKTKAGQDTYLYDITNGKGMTVTLCDYGALTQAIYVQDKDGRTIDVALGHDTIDGYEDYTGYMGATVGRVANRIANARLVIDGVEYQLDQNDNENNLHSGINGTAKKVWTVKEEGEDSMTFSIIDDGEEGFPGKALMEVTYQVTPENGLKISYYGICDHATPFNLTNHSYFNLDGSKTIYEHYLQLNASAYTPDIDSKSIPTGEIRPVEGTAFDFRIAKTIGQDINQDDEQLAIVGGYDHNFALDKTSKEVEYAGALASKTSGIRMEIYTDCPGIQIYSGNFIGGFLGKGGVPYEKRGGIAMETQYYPNSVNDPAFESPIVAAGQEYRSVTEYRFMIEK